LEEILQGILFHNINKALKFLLNGSKFIVMITETVDRSMGGVELTVGAYGKMLEDAARVKYTNNRQGTESAYRGDDFKYR
jgi:hypothetical protein